MTLKTSFGKNWPDIPIELEEVVPADRDRQIGKYPAKEGDKQGRK